jgi:hypothetical protein
MKPEDSIGRGRHRKRSHQGTRYVLKEIKVAFQILFIFGVIPVAIVIYAISCANEEPPKPAYQPVATNMFRGE